jgi:hypothetical protein
LAFSLTLSHGSALTENRLTDFTSIFAFALAGADLAPLITQLSKNEQAISSYVFSGFRALEEGGRNQQHRKCPTKSLHRQPPFRFWRHASLIAQE